jgi:hypothetical protein
MEVFNKVFKKFNEKKLLFLFSTESRIYSTGGGETWLVHSGAQYLSSIC